MIYRRDGFTNRQCAAHMAVARRLLSRADGWQSSDAGLSIEGAEQCRAPRD